MTLRQIKYFETVCKTGSVTSAAEELYVSRPVVSRALKELEEEFGVELFIRTRHGLELAESGRLLQNLFFEFTGSYEAMQRRLRHLTEHKESIVLNIGITVTCGSRIYPKLYNEFHAIYPDIDFVVTELSAFDSRRFVTNGGIDFFFTPKNLPKDVHTSMIGELPLYSNQTVLCMSESSGLASRKSIVPREIFNYPIAALYSRLPVEWPLKIVLRTSQPELIRKAVASGVAYAILPTDMIQDWDGIVGVPFEPPLLHTTRLIWNKAIPHSTAFNTFLDFMQNYDLSKL
jgi:DNA-binding transcriptional LysR family regulator